MAISLLKQPLSRLKNPIHPSPSPAEQQPCCPPVNAVDDVEVALPPLSLIKKTPLFAELSTDEQAVIARHMQLQTFQPDESLFCQGDPSDALYFIRNGWLNLFTGSQSLTMTTLGSGGLVGCTDFFLDRPRQMAAIAASDVAVWVFDRQGLLAALKESSSIGLGLGLAFGRGIVQFQHHLARSLARVPLLQDLSDEERQMIARHLSPHRYLPRETICRSGDPPTGLFFIEQGTVWRLSDRDHWVELGPQQSFGEEAVISGKPHAYTVQAETEVILWQLSLADFMALVESWPSIRQALSRNLYASLNNALSIACLVVENEIGALQLAGGSQHSLVKKLQQVSDVLAWLKDSRLLL